MVLSRRYAEAHLNPGQGPKRRTSAASLLGLGKNQRGGRPLQDATLVEEPDAEQQAEADAASAHAHAALADSEHRLDRMGNFLRVDVPQEGFKRLRLHPQLTVRDVVADVCSKRGHDPADHFLALEREDGTHCALLAGRTRVQSLKGRFYLQARAQRDVWLRRNGAGPFGLTVGRLSALRRELSTRLNDLTQASSASDAAGGAHVTTLAATLAAAEQAQTQGLYIVRVKPQSIADVQGLEAGDELICLDGMPIAATQLEDVKRVLRSSRSARFRVRSLIRAGCELTAAQNDNIDELIEAHVLLPPRPAAPLVPDTEDPAVLLRVPTPPICGSPTSRPDSQDVFYAPGTGVSSSPESARRSASRATGRSLTSPASSMLQEPASAAQRLSASTMRSALSDDSGSIAADIMVPEAGDPGLDFKRTISAFVYRTDEVSRFLKGLLDEELAEEEQEAEQEVAAAAQVVMDTAAEAARGKTSPGTAAVASAAAAAVAARRRRTADDMEVLSTAPSPTDRKMPKRSISGTFDRPCGSPHGDGASLDPTMVAEEGDDVVGGALDGSHDSVGSRLVPLSQQPSFRRRAHSTSALAGAEGRAVLESKRRKERGKLRATLRELVATEASYVGSLEFMRARFLEPLRREELLTQEQLLIVAGNIDELLAFQTELLQALRTATDVALGKEAPSAGPTAVRCLLQGSMAVADVFDARVEGFKVYAQYCSTYGRAVEIINQATNMALHQWLDARNPRQDQSGSLASYMIKPVQRVLKYPLLLREMASHLEESPAAKQRVLSALDGLSRLAGHINDMTRLCDYYERPLRRATDFALSRNFHQLLHHCEVRWLNALDDRAKPRAVVECTLLVFRTALALLERLPLTKAQKKRAKAGSGPSPAPRYGCIGMFAVKQLNKVLRGLDNTLPTSSEHEEALCWRLYVEKVEAGNGLGEVGGRDKGKGHDGADVHGGGGGGGTESKPSRSRLGALSPKLGRKKFLGTDVDRGSSGQSGVPAPGAGGGGNGHGTAAGSGGVAGVNGTGSGNGGGGGGVPRDEAAGEEGDASDEAASHRAQQVPHASGGEPLSFFAFRMESSEACSSCLQSIREAQRALARPRHSPKHSHTDSDSGSVPDSPRVEEL